MVKRNPLVSALKDMVYFGMETFGRYYSCYRAFVSSNEDPLILQRLQLVIPEIGGSTPYTYWAIPKGVFSGVGYGAQIVPRRGDLVWVEFERGHPDAPIYSLGHFGHDEIPVDDPDLADVNCIWLKSPYGHLIKINDTKKYISISTNGAEFKLDEKGLVSIKNGNTSLKKVLTNILQTYMKTTTVTGDALSPESINDAVDNLEELTKLFS